MGLLTSDIIATATAAINSLMAAPEDGGLGKHCSLIFPPKTVRCPNCGFDNQNRRSNNRYKSGGPQPFPNGGLCPVCNGNGTLNTPVTKDVVFLLNWNVRTFVSLPGMDPSNVNIELPGGVLQAKGFLVDLPAVLQARKMVVETAIEGIQKYVYVLDGQPVDAGNIIQGMYFFSFWRASGS